MISLEVKERKPSAELCHYVIKQNDTKHLLAEAS